jgi:hypothetical protein
VSEVGVTGGAARQLYGKKYRAMSAKAPKKTTLVFFMSTSLSQDQGHNVISMAVPVAD